VTDDQISGIRCYRFGHFVLDAHRVHLWRDDECVPISLKAIEVLALLVEHRGEVVTKDELLARVWPNTAVEENNLARHVSTLRKALGDNREHHDFIVTIPGVGYRFVAAVREWRPAAAATSIPELISAPEPGSANRESEVVLAPQVPRAGGFKSLARGWKVVPAAAAAVLLTAVLPIAWWAGDAAEPAEDTRTRGQLTRLTYGSGLQHQPSWSPDGTRVVFASDVSGNSDLWVQDVRHALPEPLTTAPDHEWQPAWSPDGRWIVYRSERDGGGLYVMPADGGDARRISTFGHKPRWSPSGRWILFSSSILDAAKVTPYIVGFDGRLPEPLRPDVIGRFTSAHLAWGPGGDRVSVWGRSREGGWTLVTMAPDSRNAPTESAIPDGMLDGLRESSLRPGSFAWGPGGDRLYFEGRSGDTSNLWEVAVDPVSLAWLDAPRALTMGPGIDRDFVISPDGRRLAFSVVSERTRLWSFGLGPDGRLHDGMPLTSGSAGEFDAAAPRDGRRLAFRTVRGGRQQLWERSAAGIERVLLAGNEWNGSSPRWAHDGRTLAYSRRGSGAAAIGLVDAETGTERLLQLPPNLTMELVPDDWSSDGSTILAACRPGPGQPHSTCTVAIDDSSRIVDVRVIASAPGLSLICQRFSPDERWISFMAVDDRKPGTSTLYVMPARGGPWTPVTSGRSYDDKPRWSSDGRTLYFISDRGGPVNLWGQRFDPARGIPVGEPFKASSFDNPARLVTNVLQRAEIAVSADRAFLPLTDTAGDIWVLDLPAR
jgi:Tol biopolymer transport system component/DNA-binding winged helix-turn-helix (wHTH) protein